LPGYSRRCCLHPSYDISGSFPDTYDEDGNYTVQLCEGMEVYSEDFGHTGMLIWENIGFGYDTKLLCIYPALRHSALVL